MELVLIGCLLISGYLLLLQMVMSKIEDKSRCLLAAGILLLLYFAISGGMVLILSRLVNLTYALLAVTLLVPMFALLAALKGLNRHWHDINKGFFALFLVYLLAVGYVTLFSRSKTSDAGIYLFHFDVFQKVIKTRSFALLNHVLLNIVLFIPLGFLFPFIDSTETGKIVTVVLIGLMIATLIETTQMLLSIGQCDLTDILANTFGMLTGYFLFLLCRRFQRHKE